MGLLTNRDAHNLYMLGFGPTLSDIIAADRARGGIPPIGVPGRVASRPPMFGREPEPEPIFPEPGVDLTGAIFKLPDEFDPIAFVLEGNNTGNFGWIIDTTFGGTPVVMTIKVSLGSFGGPPSPGVNTSISIVPHADWGNIFPTGTRLIWSNGFVAAERSKTMTFPSLELLEAGGFGPLILQDNILPTTPAAQLLLDQLTRIQ